MNRNLLLVVCASAIVISTETRASAADPYRNSRGTEMGVRTAPPRSFLGLPVPQQWLGAQTTGTFRGGPGAGAFAGPGTPAGNCPNGKCGPMDCANGVCRLPGSVPSACRNGNCLSGVPQAGCVNGQCARKPALASSPLTQNCPNGRCPIATTGRQPVRAADPEWTPRGTRMTEPADPFEKPETDRISGAALRFVRPAVEPIRDTFSSDYDSSRLELRSDYFRGEQGRGREPLNRNNQPTLESRERGLQGTDRQTQPARRTMDAPLGRTPVTARI